METFTPAREFVANSGYADARQRALAAMDLAAIDAPIKDIVEEFAAIPCCFTLQCCYGHFVSEAGQDPHNIERVPSDFESTVTYRIAYMAFCLQNSSRGRALWQSLARLSAVDPDYIQFGSADWFWERWANSYALQVGPADYMLQDKAMLSPPEAQRTQSARDLLFAELRALLASTSCE